jgi:hypothetical protein
MGTFVRRLIALTVVWLLATAALTYAAAQKMGTPTAAPAVTTTAAPAAQPELTVPDVRRQAYVFAKGTLGDAGFAWKVQGSVRGFASNTVVSQTPAPGTRVVDTGAPTIVLRLSVSGRQLGVPDNVSPVTGTPVKLAGLAVNPVPAAKAAPAVEKKAAVKKVAVKKTAPTKQQAPDSRPPAFAVAGARKEPLDEIPLTARANALMNWLARNPQPTDANVQHWLFQHAWIVAGARMGWWHGEQALETLVKADARVWQLWGIGARSAAVAKNALAEVEARTP